MKQLTDEADGLYMRYCDDFIVVLPDETSPSFELVKERIHDMITETKGLKIKSEKTKSYHLQDQHIQCLDASGKNAVDYLGFTFDGSKVCIRSKTTSRFYNKLYRKVRGIYHCKNAPSGTTNLYRKYSCRGAVYYRKAKSSKGSPKSMSGNYLDYVHRAKSQYVNSSIDRPTRHHMEKNSTWSEKTSQSIA